MHIVGYMPNQVQAVLQALQDAQTTINCAGCDLRGVIDFAGKDLHGIFMPNVSMQPCLPTDANKNSNMICNPKQLADFKKTNLAGAILSSSCLDGVSFDQADLTGVDVSNSSVQYASLQGAIVKDMITDHATFCHTIMPDGIECKDSWTGQGTTIACNCRKENFEKQEISSLADSDQVTTTKADSDEIKTTDS
jgi:uncharacterized protein YjbI with pentapeptide repeats